MIHPACAELFSRFMNAILVRGQMDESVRHVMETTGQDFELVRSSIDYAMSKQNVAVQRALKALLDCECEILREERRGA